MRVLMVLDGGDDELRPIRDALAVRGHHVIEATQRDAVENVTSAPFSTVELIVADASLASRVDLVGRLAATSPGIEVVTVGNHEGQLPADVLAHLERPIELDRLLAVVDEVADILDGERLREPVDLVDWQTLFAGESPAVRTLLRRVRLVARSDAPVWIYGDDGSGRAIVARAIHDRSVRRAHPFIAFNTAALSDDELCERLFQGSEAAIRSAASGSIFLEQVSTAGPRTQRELLQFIERKRADDTASTPRLLVGVQPVEARTETQRLFSPELYYRLKVLELEIPRLKDRARDLEQIVAHMLGRLMSSTGDPPTVTAEAMHRLERYEFPGNLLELAHALTHAVVLAHGSAIEPQHLPASMRETSSAVSAGQGQPAELGSLDSVAKRFERDYLLRVLRSVGGNRGHAAEILGLSRKGLWGKLKSHGISDDDIESDETPPDSER